MHLDAVEVSGPNQYRVKPPALVSTCVPLMVVAISVVPDELVHAEVATERRMHARFPDAEQAELAETFRGYGADPETAARMAEAVSRDPDTALRVHTREELGVDPFELPSALVAGLSSLIAFSAGALIPLLPYLAGVPVLGAALGITAVALLAGGMVVGRLTGRPPLRSGLRQLALGFLAVAVTFIVGSLIGGHVALPRGSHKPQA